MDQGEELFVTVRDHLHQNVELAGDEHDEVDGIDAGKFFCYCFGVRARPQSDHRLVREAELERVGDGNDLHHPVLDEPTHAGPRTGLGHP